MYFLFRLHGKFPQEYYNLTNSEKIIVRQFILQEIKDINKENEMG
jgi:hypothetical protein